jgi:hypothetical protein
VLLNRLLLIMAIVGMGMTGTVVVVAGMGLVAAMGMVVMAAVMTGTATVAAVKRTSRCVATRQDFLPRSF